MHAPSFRVVTFVLAASYLSMGPLTALGQAPSDESGSGDAAPTPKRQYTTPPAPMDAPPPPGKEAVPAITMPVPKPGQMGTSRDSEPVTQSGIHVVVFSADGRVAASVQVSIEGGASGVTNSVGSVQLAAPPGQYRLFLTLPGASQPARIEGVGVATGKVTEVIATAIDGGGVEADVMAPAEAEAAAQEAEAEKQTAEVKAKGSVSGTVVAVEGGAVVKGASVFVAGLEVEAQTDAAGHFLLEVPVGTHILSIIHPDFSTQTVRDVVVTEAATTEVRIELTPVAIELQDFVVTAPHISGGVASMIEDRKNSATVSDAIGAEDIARLPTNDAAGAAQRVVGATIVGGRFVYVRGLGERYSNSLLNGAPLPSPEPDRATVPLDLFPSQILESLDIVKTFTPDMPGDFAGGSVRITTKAVPEKETFAVSLGAGANTNSTFTKTYGQEGSSTDFLGFDDGQRALPDGIPTEYPLSRGAIKPDGTRVTREELDAGAERFTTSFGPRRKTNWPNLRGSISYGNGWKLGDNVRMGVLTSLLYRRDFSFRNETSNNYNFSSDMGLVPLVESQIETTNSGVRWGAFGSSAIQIGDEHKIALVGMRSQLADATTRIIESKNYNRNQFVDSTRMEYASRFLTFGQLQGEHKLTLLNDAEVHWVGSLANAGRDADDTRDAVFQRSFTGVGEYAFVPDNNSGRHFYATQDEDAQVVGLDWRQPITDGWFTTAAKAGTLISMKAREFQARNFTTDVGRSNVFCGTSYDPIRCANALDNPSDADLTLSINETSQRSDSYDAGLDVYAGYLMAEVALGEHWKLLGGARLEQTDQFVQVVDPFTREAVEGEGTGAKLNQLDVLPGGAVVFSPFEDANIRAAVSQTIARPQLRELAPFAFAEFFGGPSTSGNPDLQLTRILNGDLRFEYFPTSREVLAVSVFAKDFTNPIEPLRIPGSGDAGYAVFYDNTPGAVLYGAEAEARKSLDFISQALEDFSVNISLMVAKSEIEASTEQDASGNRVATSLNRPMVQAAPFVINAALDYENEDGYQFRILYNVSGAKLNTVGVRRVPDGYEHPRHVIDITASKNLGESFTLKLNLQNLLNAEYLTTLGRTERKNNVVSRYREGISASLSLTYTN